MSIESDFPTGVMAVGGSLNGKNRAFANNSFSLTKREYFAAMAMQGLSANPGGPWQANHQNGWALCNCTLSEAMHIAVETADALLAALEAKPEVSSD